MTLPWGEALKNRNDIPRASDRGVEGLVPKS